MCTGGTILEINYELIRACIEYQKQGLVNTQDMTLYKARLRSNLSYLATIAVELNGNVSGNIIKSVNLPDLTPLPIPRGLGGQKLNILIQQADHIFSTIAQQFQQNQSTQQQQQNIDNMTDYNATMIEVAAAAATPNRDNNPYNILRPLVGNVVSGQTRIIPSLMTGMSDQYAETGVVTAASLQQKQFQHLQNVGFPTGFINTTDAVTNTGFNPTNAYHMARYPINNNNLENDVIGINELTAANGFVNNGIASGTIGLPNMLNHENEI
ncbi:53_t:CDS:2 [Entrophospora sp. SA101]|nr:13903_t:CDS:2 [Entrophospora sp. SA101]CAJ0646141.1 7582_t:CDS:2 [Entrophospora sp. SA101]CAJ0646145.1 7585_t:CDS:2 [Entrophospora sp. SA101]CAJ0763798.1 53_t:CDS:2 [Entrophospora sp. SA101]CAJ0831057.1 7418_t:CDS:2 [Entrophospora sp. SA101]